MNKPVINTASRCLDVIIRNSDAASYLLESLCVILDERNSGTTKTDVFNDLMDHEHLYEKCLEIKELFKDVAGIRTALEPNPLYDCLTYIKKGEDTCEK